MVESEKAARKEREEARVPVNNLDLGNAKTKAREETGRRQQQMRQQRLEATRSQPVLDLDCSAIVDLLDMMAETHAPEPDHSSQNAEPHRPTRVRTQPKLYQSEGEEAMERERRRGADPGGAAGSQQDTGVERDGLVGMATAKPKATIGRKGRDWEKPRTQDLQPTGIQCSTATSRPGTTRQGRATHLNRYQPGGVTPGQCRKHLQGSLQRGTTPAPKPPAPALGLILAATLVGQKLIPP